MCSEGVPRFSTRTTPLSTVEVVVSCAEMGTIPGQSMRYIRRMSVIYCQTYSGIRISVESGYIVLMGEASTLVSPGMGATLHTLSFLRQLMTEDLPTLGYPMKPTEICFLSE